MGPGEVALVAAGSGLSATVRNLNQLYLHDLSENAGWDCAEDGRFADQDVAGYWQDPRCHPFLLRVDGGLAGFAVVDTYSHLSGESGIRDIAEFFVLRKYRRIGVGRRAAGMLFDQFPGPWEVRQLPSNTVATAFWLSIITELTGGRFTDCRVDWPEPVRVQAFTHPAPPGGAPPRPTGAPAPAEPMTS
jgi:predicted acetyltransferase